MANFNNFNGSVLQGPERSKRKALFVFEFWNNPNSLHIPPETLIKDFQVKRPGETLESFTTILDVEVSEEQRQRALQSCGVTLISPNRVKGTDPSRDRPNRDWLYYHEIYYPNLRETTGDVHYVVGCDPLTAKESSRIHECLFPDAELHLISHPQGVLFVFTSLREEVGLTHYHRTLISDFCKRKLLIGKLNVYSTVLDVEISDRERKYAENYRVTLIPAQRKPFEDPDEDPVKEQWLFHHEIYYPNLKQLPNIKYVVGYLPKTGKAAADIKSRLFPDAQLFLINHKYPDDPYQMTTTESRQKLERQMLVMASNADAVFSLGPNMHAFFENAYRAPQGQRELSRMVHLELLPRPSSRFFRKNVTLPKVVKQHEIVTYGKMDVDTLERSKTIVVAIGETGNLRKVNRKTPPKWKVIGISPANERVVHHFLVEAMQCAHISPTPYRDCSLKELIKYLQQSHLCVITPSSGDYGFEGLEALAIGLPTLMPENSQVAGLIKKCFKNHADTCVVDSQEWSEKIMRTLSDVQTAFHHAKRLKDEYYKNQDVRESYERFAALFPVQCETSTSLPVTVSLKTANETNGSTDGRIAIERCFNENSASIASSECACCDIEENARSAMGKGVSVVAVQDGSLVIIMSFTSLIYLHRLKAVCISGYLAEILEPKLLTEEMRKMAAKFGIKLQLQATYDETRFHQVESFFLKRDGGRDQLEQLADDSNEESTDEEVEEEPKMESTVKEGAEAEEANNRGWYSDDICLMTPSRDEEKQSPNNETDVDVVEPLDKYEDSVGISGKVAQPLKQVRPTFRTDVGSAVSDPTVRSVDTGVGNTAQSKAMDERDESFDQEETKQEQPFVYAADDDPRWETKERTPGDGGSVEAVERSRGLEELVPLRNDQEAATEEQPIDANISKVGSTVLCTEGRSEGSAGYFAKIRYSKEAQHKEIQIPIDLEETISDLAKKVLDIRHKFPLIPEDQRLVRKEHAEIQIYEKNSFGSSMNSLDNQTKLSTVNYKMLEFDIRTGPSRHSELKDDITRNVCGQNIALFGYDGSGKSSLINTFYRALKGQYVQVAQVFPKGGFERGTRVYANCSFKFGDKTLSWNEVPGLTFRNVVGHRSRKLSEHVLSGKAKRNKPVRLPRVSSFRRPRSHEKIHAIVYVHDSTKDTHAEGIQATLGRVRVLPKYGQGIPMFIILTHTDLPVHETLEENLSAFCEDSGINSGNVFRVPYYDQEQERKGDDGGYERDVEVLSILKTIVTEAKIYKERGGADVVST